MADTCGPAATDSTTLDVDQYPTKRAASLETQASDDGLNEVELKSAVANDHSPAAPLAAPTGASSDEADEAWWATFRAELEHHVREPAPSASEDAKDTAPATAPRRGRAQTSHHRKGVLTRGCKRSSVSREREARTAKEQRE